MSGHQPSSASGWLVFAEQWQSWRGERDPSGPLASVTGRLIPENFGEQIELRAVAFLAAPGAAVSLIVAGRAVLSAGRLNQAHEPALAVASFLAILLPLVILVAVSVFAAFRKRRAEFLLSGSLVWSAAAFMLYLVLAFDRRLVSSEIVLLVQAVQAVGVAAVVFGLGWQLADWRWPMLSDADSAAEDLDSIELSADPGTTAKASGLAKRPSSRLH